MKLYRVSYSIGGGNSGGYSWHTSKREAQAAAKRDYDEDPSEYDNYNTKDIDERIDVVTVERTKAGILKVLTHYASYPDNG